VSSGWARAALSHRICTGIGRRKLGKLIEELAPPWLAQQESRLRDRRGGRDRMRAEGAGPDRELPFSDRVIVTLVILRFQLPHAALAVFYGVHRSTITRAVGEIRPLLAQRGFAVPGQPGLRLRTLADVFAYAAAEGVTLRIDGTEVQVRRPRANRPGRRAFVSGKKKQNTCKATAASDGDGRLVWLGAFRPGRMHDGTALRSEGIEDLLHRYPKVKAEADAGYQGLARDFPPRSAPRRRNQARTPRPKKPPAGNNAGTSSPPSGSASSTPSPNPSSGGPCSATSDAVNISRKPPWPSPHWSPTAPPRGDHTSASPPARHEPTPIVHLLVSTRESSRQMARRSVWLSTG
jgi:DDE superfamily endonuclease/Helix-turn-helix of DDE superfamily endonuclease